MTGDGAFVSGVAFGPAQHVELGVPGERALSGTVMGLPEPGDAAALRALVAGASAAGSALGLPYEPQPRPVARYPATTGEGHDVTVCVTRLPSVAYELHAPGLGLHLATGSDSEMTEMAEVVHAVACAVADGMLGFCGPLA